MLLVEDHPDTAFVLARLLERNGFQVRRAASIREALELSRAESFDVVVSDIGLPDGNGYDLMREIRGQGDLPGIAMSGYGMDEDLRRSREAGFVDHLVKPVNVTHLASVLRRVSSAAAAATA